MKPLVRIWLPYLPLLLSVVLFGIFRHFFLHQVGDDSYIYFRYVDRALAGQWWSWSGHIPPVEGYSSPLWYLLLVFSGKVGLPVQLAAQGWGSVLALTTLAGCWFLARELKAPPLFAGMACLLFSINHGVNYWATSGLETSLYAALLVWSCLGIIRERFWWLPTALLGLARPEGIFLLTGILIAVAVVKRGRISFQHILAAFIPTLAWLVLRLSFYGDILPNTFYAKATGELPGQILRGTLYSLPVLIPIMAAWMVWWKQRDQPVMVALGVASMLLGIVLLGGGDWMFHFRLLVPLFALVLPVLAAQWPVLGAVQKQLLAVAAAPLFMLSVPISYWLPALQAQQLPVTHYQEGSMTHASLELGLMMSERYPAGGLVAVNHAGALPWALPKFDVVDMVGLNDAHIARAQGRLHHKYDTAYVLAMRPDFIILNSRTRPGTAGIWYHKGYWSGEDALVDHPDFIRDYEPSDMVAEWHWHVPFPYDLVVGDVETSWILVYRRKH